MKNDTTEQRFEVSHDLLADLERRARHERDQYMAECLGAGYQRMRRGITSLVNSLSARSGRTPRQA
ncbi:hypothetical protein HC341_18180 [Aquisalimonas sp. 2447]|uniref:hypothetical protein n=1 Tax=Aquisalimonas sp. 2447 TaxID=2740807 RepID=UPI00143238E6|nr:hypothetical protein [Aquisalimonas sp. 2447]QIT56955.1 hypothetical protein HC341_18180 [Aquisalimonas sp. 2447]